MEINIPDLDLFGSNKKTLNKFIKIKHNITEKMVWYQKAYDLVDEIKINKGETVYCMLTGDFVFGDFIGAFIQNNNLEVKELTIISLSGSKDIYNMFDELMIQGWVAKINLLLSSYYLNTEKIKHTGTIRQLEELSDKHKANFNVYYSRVHQKIILIETKQGGKVVMHGSANLKSCQALEQLMIQENKELYDFNYKYFQELINK